MVTPRISLCLIVRDESAVLDACLRSVRGAVDEIVVVDTGSVDDTVAIARRHGAAIGHFVWVDDFAAARNETLRLATGDYVLWLDADERLAPGAARALREAVAGGRLDCGMLPLHAVRSAGAPADAVLSGAERQGAPTLVARLARRTPDLRWQGRVHESWRDWLAAPGRRIGRVDASILHDGAAAEVRDPEARRKRNVALLRLRAAEEPEDVLSRGYLAVDLYNGGARSEARAFAEQAMAILWRQSATPTGIRQPGAAVHAVTAFGWAALVDGRHGEVRDAARLLRGQGSTHPNLAWLEGVAEENLALRAARAEQPAGLARAEQAYRDALAVEERVFAQAVVDDARGADIRVRIGTVRLQLGAPAEALELADAALRFRPTDAPARLLRAEALIDLGRHADALAVLEPMLSPTAADAWLLAAAAAMPHDPVAGRALLSRAHSLAREHLRGLHRLARLNALLATETA